MLDYISKEFLVGVRADEDKLPSYRVIHLESGIISSLILWILLFRILIHMHTGRELNYPLLTRPIPTPRLFFLSGSVS
jgi:hypothetical protein